MIKIRFSNFSTIFLIIFCFTYISSIAQNKLSYKTEERNCEELCSKSFGVCHFEKAMYLLQGYKYDSDLSQCVKSEFVKFDVLNPLQRVEQGINELERVIQNPIGIDESQIDLKLRLAGAKIKLSHFSAELNNFKVSEQQMKEAGDIYLSLLPKEQESENAQELINKIVVGLIHCNRNLEALNILNKLPSNNPNRAYLSAEAFFSMANRKMAAQKYENWISLGCKSDLLMIVTDENIKQWTFLLSTEPPNLTLCEQLPSEIRSRFEILNKQFNHPNNIPIRNYPSVIFKELIM